MTRCTLGAGAFVHYGDEIGDQAMIAADSFLMKGEDVPPTQPLGWQPGPGDGGRAGGRRRGVTGSGVMLEVERRPGAPALLRADPGDPLRWAWEARAELRDAVVEHGAVLVRGLALDHAVVAGDVVRGVGEGLMAEREPFAPRTEYAERLYSTTPWPAHQPMGLHHEGAYCRWFPGLVMFACLRAPDAGGDTLLADTAAVLRDLPAELVRRCERDGWQLVRTYNDDIGATWPEAFGVRDRATVERYCRANAIEFEWRPGGRLRTRQRRAAVQEHPVTGLRCWFNEIAFLSEWASGPEVREYLLEAHGPERLPVTTCFGDGSPVGEDVVALLNRAYAAHTVRVSWQVGDLLLVDNVRTAHGRDAYEGPRELLVALADPVRAPDVPPAGHARDDSPPVPEEEPGS